jgi:drug/metabolite transporter (DMT)-like permease
MLTQLRRLTSSPLFVHFMLLVANLCFAMSYFAAIYPLKTINSVHYTTFRCAVATVFLLIFWLVWDRNFVFEYRKEAVEKSMGFKAWAIGKMPNVRDTIVLAAAGIVMIPLNINV